MKWMGWLSTGPQRQLYSGAESTDGSMGGAHGLKGEQVSVLRELPVGWRQKRYCLPIPRKEMRVLFPDSGGKSVARVEPPTPKKYGNP